MSIQATELLSYAKYFSPISHTLGRLRIRVNPALKNVVKDKKESDLKALIAQINGIKEVKLNLLLGSITILYDNEIFPKELWDDFLAQRNQEELANKINSVKKEINA